MSNQEASQQSAQEIAELNLTYILLAQKLLRQDRVGAMLRLGLSADLADMLIGMSLAQVMTLASSNFVLCGFRTDQLPVGHVVQQVKSSALQQAHLSIVLATSRKAAQRQLAAFPA